MGLDPSPIHMRPPEPVPFPVRVDVINGWSLYQCSHPKSVSGWTRPAENVSQTIFPFPHVNAGKLGLLENIEQKCIYSPISTQFSP